MFKVSCYTFHDGYLHYTHLLQGVLPNFLKPVSIDSEYIRMRFLKAALGWIRYKPLFLHITGRENYENEIEKIYEKLLKIIPKCCRFFQTRGFIQIYNEFERYHKLVKKHFEEFETAKSVWEKFIKFVPSADCIADEILINGKFLGKENVYL